MPLNSSCARLSIRTFSSLCEKKEKDIKTEKREQQKCVVWGGSWGEVASSPSCGKADALILTAPPGETPTTLPGEGKTQNNQKKKGRGKRRVLKIKRLEKRALREVVAAAHVARSPISLSYLFCFFSHRTPAATRATRCGGRRCISFPSCFFVKAAATNSSSVALWRSECRKQGKKSQYVLFFPRHLRRNAGRCRSPAGGFVAFRFRFEVET